MPFGYSFQLSASRIIQAVCAAIAIALISVVVASFHSRPRVWPVAEVPVAFWAWRNQSPAEADVRAAIEQAEARTIFLRAGQIDYQDGKLRRIRPLSGALPRGIELQLVYNATPWLLSHLESVEEKTLAAAIAEAYQVDSERAGRQHANVTGLQVDIDFPTRLLARYASTLRALRGSLKQGQQLSITGLPTWMDSRELDNVLESVSFWVPQFYGAELPQRSDQVIPISSPRNIADFVNKARHLDRPFYAGLAAYSWALLYSPSGSLISVRGDMDLTTIASDPNLELMDQRSFDVVSPISSAKEWRTTFRAKAGGVTQGLAMHAGDVLVVDVPSSESLRAAARVVRELAGKQLRGICVFRLPARDDPATLTVEQVTSALNDEDSAPRIDIRIKSETPESKSLQTGPGRWRLELKNMGTASALVGTATIDLVVRLGTFETLTSQTAAVVTMCEVPNPTSSVRTLQSCSQRRANVIRLKPQTLKPGQTLEAVLVLKQDPPQTMTVSIEMQTDAGPSFSVKQEVPVETGVNR